MIFRVTFRKANTPIGKLFSVPTRPDGLKWLMSGLVSTRYAIVLDFQSHGGSEGSPHLSSLTASSVRAVFKSLSLSFKSKLSMLLGNHQSLLDFVFSKATQITTTAEEVL